MKHYAARFGMSLSEYVEQNHKLCKSHVLGLYGSIDSIEIDSNPMSKLFADATADYKSSKQ